MSARVTGRKFIHMCMYVCVYIYRHMYTKGINIGFIDRSKMQGTFEGGNMSDRGRIRFMSTGVPGVLAGIMLCPSHTVPSAARTWDCAGRTLIPTTR